MPPHVTLETIAVWLELVERVVAMLSISSFYARILSFNTYKENYCRLWRLCTKRTEGHLYLPTNKAQSSICCQVLPFVSHRQLGPIHCGKCISVLVISLVVSLITELHKLRTLSADASIIWFRTELHQWLKTYSKLIQVSSLFFWAPASLMVKKSPNVHHYVITVTLVPPFEQLQFCLCYLYA